LPLTQSVTALQLWPFFFLQFPLASQLLTTLQAFGSSAFVMTVVHVPAEFAQDRQGVVQASAQHVPSTQYPLAHSVLEPQVWPFSLEHTPAALQMLGEAQLSCWLPTTVVQVPAELAHERHGAVQVSWQHVLSMQFPVAHWPPLVHDCPAFSLHVPVASHWLVPLHPLGSSALTIVVQSPGVGLWSQDEQTAQLETSQQTPSRQCPVSHWLSFVQPPPRAWYSQTSETGSVLPVFEPPNITLRPRLLSKAMPAVLRSGGPLDATFVQSVPFHSQVSA
jgi:hypothetical protein